MSVALFKWLDKPHDTLDNLRNLATVFGSGVLPVTAAGAARFAGERERKRATLDLTRRFSTDPNIAGRLQRFYFYRMHESASANASDRPPNPFRDDTELKAESIALLNFCETIAIELREGLFDRKLFLGSLDTSLVGIHDVVLTRLTDRFGMDLSGAYQEFRTLVVEITRLRARRGARSPTQIPDARADPKAPAHL